MPFDLSKFKKKKPEDKKKDKDKKKMTSPSKNFMKRFESAGNSTKSDTTASKIHAVGRA